jgi:cob(I)alamin adenosyltransferase
VPYGISVNAFGWDVRKRVMGDIYLYTGTGGGKTANALGLALRCVGHRKKVVIIQFLKYWKNTGEYKIRNRLKSHYRIYQFGRKGWKGLKNLGPRDRALCHKGLEKARQALKERPSLLVLDEINLALHTKMLDLKEVLEFLDSVPKGTDLVLTGRYAPRALVNRAEYVIEVVDRKHPKKPASKPGIQY